MPDPLAVADDVADIWRPLSTDEAARATRLIAKASAMLRAACPFDVDDRIALGQTDPTNPQALDASVVATVVAEIVKRTFVNPEGAASQTETVGPYSKSSTFTARVDQHGDAETRGRLIVLPEDIAQLRPVQPFSPGFTVRTRAPRRDRHNRRLADELGFIP